MTGLLVVVLGPLIVQVLLGLGFLVLICTQIYAEINKNHSRKVARKQHGSKRKNTIGKYRMMSRIANVAGNLISFFALVYIFLSNYISKYFFPLDFSVYSTAIELIGFIITIFGCGIMFAAYRALGANWISGDQRDGRIPLPAEQELVQTGIYKHIRHPLYLASYFVFGGFTLMMLDGLMLILFIIYAIGIYFQAVDEEKALLDHFGDQYAKYLQRSGRFFPK
jgi:protein-S-isoprenylcysteine O-methyltransferase Ste14